MEPYSEHLEVSPYVTVEFPASKPLEEWWAYAGIEDMLPASPTRAEAADAYNRKYELDPEDASEALTVDEEDNIVTTTTSNPDGKWDWYQLGGRWSGFLPIKPGSRVFELDEQSWAAGERGLGSESAELPEDRADTADIIDIDFDGEFQRVYDEVAEEYDAYSRVFAKHGEIMGWSAFFAAKQAEGMTREAIGAEWTIYSKPFAKDLEKFPSSFFGPDIITRMGKPDDPDQREKVALRAATRSMLPGAIIWESTGWEESPEQWMVAPDNLDDVHAWQEEQTKRLRALPGDTRIWAVDIHS
jgi:hypothetical protein